MSEQKKLSNVNNLAGTIEVPGDKSISHRAVMFGSLANGKTVITNFLMGADCLSTVDCFRKMGVSIDIQEGTVTVEGKGYDGLVEPSSILDVGNSGTTTRLMMGILAGSSFHSCIIGDESIAKRPMARVTKPLRLMGAKIDGRENGQFTPLAIRGGELHGIKYESPVASAQVKSAILLAGLKTNQEETTVIEPHKSRDHTERMLRAFGVEVKEDEISATVKGGQSLTATNIFVPGDISSAAFFLVAGAIVPNSEIILKNVGINPTRTGILDVLKMMGASIEIIPHKEDAFEPIADIVIKTSSLKGTTISGDLIPKLIDEIPVIALLATQAEGETIIKDASELKVKETNRIDTVVGELSKIGATIKGTDDGMIITGKTKLVGNATVSSHGDHRIGMMLAVASCITQDAITLYDAKAIEVSYPNFFDHLALLSK
ncbi:3-phosphoshikimate 1-carboxyvinyltransferase [Metabacillus sediminilitoris]|uniref:3-phosphoshikimate 1-carboxyvinyltransferase n=1 Tax=Metabacillus sediminilitoris TaxID=2567941 RepID=A0A4S4CAG7_9BACI|nr:3-phosphoshikimate 1-carboxyvinyltransferase [Metabacillus sediminilitoris]QGQ46682.1 3-phosphoshikimate 1-carboxyvinyltransferase [Metabacillus sediminilitoris]THF82832.1 3-phosphoshikimate 1-carboxyvinyltransferase [Metabacillus sediminilitoris]